MRAPQRGDAIHQRQCGVGILSDVEDREIIIDEGVYQHPDGSRDHDELAGDGGRRRRGPPIAAQRRPHNAKECLQTREQ